MDRGAWRATVQGVTRSRARLSLTSLTSAEEGAHFRRRMMVRVAQQYEHT